MSNGYFRISDREFWADPSVRSTEIARSFAHADRIGVFLDAPRNAPLDAESLPVTLLDLRSLREHDEVDAEEAMLLVAVRHEDNQLFVERPLVVDKPRPPEEPSSEPPGEGFKAKFHVVDTFDALGISQGRATFTFAAMLRERVSNLCETTVGPSGEGFRDDELEAYIEKRRRRARPTTPRVWPPLPSIEGAISRALDGGTNPFPNYRQRNESPSVPDEEGLTFFVDRVAEPGRGRRCVMRGAFRLPAGPYEQVPVDPQTERLMDVGAPGATAVISIHIVATGTSHVGPIVLPLKIPSFDPVPQGGGLVTGHFNIDLFEVDAMPVTTGTYFLTAFSRGVVRGPAPLGIAPTMD